MDSVKGQRAVSTPFCHVTAMKFATTRLVPQLIQPFKTDDGVAESRYMHVLA